MHLYVHYSIIYNGYGNKLSALNEWMDNEDVVSSY